MDSSIHTHFGALIDPRMERTQKHPLINILFIAICGVLSGAETWVSIERYGNTKQAWLKQFLDLRHGIPSHDTFNRVFALLDADAFCERFIAWVGGLASDIKEVIAIDGKAMRATKNTIDNIGPLYLVNAWCTANQLVLGQVKVESKSNEITAIPILLDLIDVKGATITMDAMGCQKEIVKKIRKKDANYVLSLKGNQGNLHDDITLLFRALEKKEVKADYRCHQTLDGEHGRIETREYWTTDTLDWLNDKALWADLETVTMVKSTREIKNKSTTEYRFYISDLPLLEYKKIAHSIRVHWQVENCLHWSLDVSFNEDRWRSNLGNCAANMGMLNKIALNLLRKEKSAKVGIKTKRLMAAWDDRYLLKVLSTEQI